MKQITKVVFFALVCAAFFYAGQAYGKRRFAPKDAPREDGATVGIVIQDDLTTVVHDWQIPRGRQGFVAMGVRDDNGSLTKVSNGDFTAFRMDADGYVYARCK